jgi:hypothetical protein
MEKGKSFQNWDKNKKKKREVSEENKTRKALKTNTFFIMVVGN